jgi:DNA-binding NtrC family response regulator
MLDLESPPPHSTTSVQPPTSVQVLVVDDDADLLAATQRTLERAGYEVTTASDGMEAIGTLGRGDFDLVVSDIDMPRLDGLGLLRAVRDAERQTPFIFVTGQPRIDTAIFAVNNAVAYYLTKPFEPDDLVNAAKRAVGARRLERLRQNMAQVVNDQRRVLEEEGTRFRACARQGGAGEPQRPAPHHPLRRALRLLRAAYGDHGGRTDRRHARSGL